MTIFLKDTTNDINENISFSQLNTEIYSVQEALIYSEIAWNNITIQAMQEEYKVLNEGKALDTIKEWIKKVKDWIKNVFLKIINKISEIVMKLLKRSKNNKQPKQNKDKFNIKEYIVALMRKDSLIEKDFTNFKFPKFEIASLSSIKFEFESDNDINVIDKCFKKLESSIERFEFYKLSDHDDLIEVSRSDIKIDLIPNIQNKIDSILKKDTIK